MLSTVEFIRAPAFFPSRQKHSRHPKRLFIKRLESVEKKRIMSVRNAVLSSGMVRNQLKTAFRTKRRGLSSSGDVLAAWRRPSAHWPSYRETDSGFKTAVATPSSIFTRFGSQIFSSLLAPERRSTWTSLLIGCGDKGGAAILAGTATKRRLSPEKFMPEWNVGGGLCKAVQTSLKISVAVNHFRHDLSSFHLNDSCIIYKTVPVIRIKWTFFFCTSAVGNIFRTDRYLATSAWQIGAERNTGVRANCLL